MSRLRPFVSDPRRRLWAVVLILFAAYGAADFAKFQRSMRTRLPTLKRWLPYAAEVGRDDRLYDDHPDYLYPPFFLVALRPLTHVPPAVAAAVWQVAKYASIVLIFAAAWAVVRRGGTIPDWAKIATIVVTARFVHSDLRHGNVNLFIAALVVGGAWLFAGGRRGLAGAAVGLAACVKLTPALWLAWLVYRRQWRALIGAAVVAVMAVEYLPLLVMPGETNHRLLRRWYEHVVGSFVAEGRIDSVGMNQSLAAVTNRILGRSGLPQEEGRATLIDLEDATIRRVQRGAALALLAVAAWACRGRLRAEGALDGRAAEAFALEWSILAPVTLAVSGYTWTGHFCLLILPVSALFAHWARGREAGALRTLRGRAAVVLTAVPALVFVASSDVLTPAGREWAVRMGVLLWGALLTLAALILARESARGADTIAGGPAGPPLPGKLLRAESSRDG